MPTIRLFRGDLTPIEQFKIEQASNYSLLGKGIYLTNSKHIAASYRTKGMGFEAMTSRSIESFSAYSNCDDKRKAIWDVFPHFLAYVGGSRLERASLSQYVKNAKLGKSQAPLPPNILQVLQDYKNQYTQLVNEKKIVALSMSRDIVTHRGMKWLITYNPEKMSVGHVSTFEFDVEELQSTLVNVGTKHVRQFLALIYDTYNEHQFLRYFPSKEDYVNFNSRDLKLLEAMQFRNDQINRLAVVLKRQGFKGFEYEGGRMISQTDARHRAFCVWDDKWVNQHRIQESSCVP